MKSKLISFITLLALTVMISFQGCEKVSDSKIVEHYVFTTPSAEGPVDGAFVHSNATSVNLTWTSENKSGDPIDADVYWGTAAEPPLYRADVTAASLSVPVEAGTTYYWKVVMKDANGIKTNGPTWSFTYLCVYDPAMAIGSYHSVSAPSEWNSEGDITITADPNDPNTVFVTGIEALEGVDENRGPLVMHIDPATNEVIADKSLLATDAFGYTNLTYEGTGIYNACDGSYSMNFDISVDEGDFGTYAFTFTRNP